MKPERLLVPLAAIAVAVFGTSRLMVAIDPGEAHPTGLPHDTAESLKGEVRRAIGGDRRGGGRGSRETYSFYSPTGMRQLRKLIQAEGGYEGRIPIFRIQSDQAQVQVARGRHGRVLVVDRGPSVKFSVSTSVAISNGFRLSQLDVQAPRRILTAIARASDASPKDVTYMVFSTNPIDRAGRWDAFVTESAMHFAADAHGRHVTRP